MNFIGYVALGTPKTGIGKKGPWTLNSFKIRAADGSESDWISAGFDPLTFKDGDYISGSAEEVDYKGKKQVKLLPDTVKQEKPPKGSTGAPASRTQQQINWQAARNSAVAVTQLLLAAEAIPLPAKAKRTEAVVYDILHDVVDKLTVEYWNDTESLRKLESVQDAGALEEPEDAESGDETDKDE